MEAELQDAPLRGDRITLMPILPAHYEQLYQMELSNQMAQRWRHKGATPSYEMFVQTLWGGILTQYLVVANDTSRIVGMVSAYNANFKDDYAWLAVAKFDPGDQSLMILHGAAQFIDYLFGTWAFRKLYAESPEYSYQQFRSGLGVLFEEEGCLRDHEYLRGRYWDLHHLSVYRERWEKLAPIVMAYVSRGERFRQDPDLPQPTRAWIPS